MQEQVAVLEDYDDDEEMEKPLEKVNKDDLTQLEASIFDKFASSEVVADLVIASMENLPEVMPAHFVSAFTPIDVAGTETQIKHVSRMLAAQITAYQLGPAAALQGDRATTEMEEDPEQNQIQSLVSGTLSAVPEKKEKVSLLQQPVITASKKKIPKALKLSEVTKPLTQEEKQRHLAGAVRRILQTGQAMSAVKTRLICSVASSSTFELRFRKFQLDKI